MPAFKHKPNISIQIHSAKTHFQNILKNPNIPMWLKRRSL